MAIEKIYIAGKITGDPNYKAKFQQAQKWAEERGCIVLNPAVLPDGMAPADYMRICLAMIDCADTVAFLPDWAQSYGAGIKHRYCEYTSKPVVYL